MWEGGRNLVRKGAGVPNRELEHNGQNSYEKKIYQPQMSSVLHLTLTLRLHNDCQAGCLLLDALRGLSK